jgi:bifunctional non-homologous end joining protein LigD
MKSKSGALATAMLATTMTQERLLEVCADPDWVLQQKFDGHRLAIRFQDGFLRGFARNGTSKEIPLVIADALAPISRIGEFWLDGELIPGSAGLRSASAYHVFDMMVDWASDLPFAARSGMVEAIVGVLNSPVAAPVETVYEETDKLHFVRRMLESGAEGVIARDANAVYEAGRRSKGCLRFKFTKSLDSVVLEKSRDQKDNLVLGLWDGERFVEVGKVSALTGDGPRVEKGDVVEIGYLYVGANGRLVQPVRPRLRTDKEPQECLIEQLT